MLQESPARMSVPATQDLIPPRPAVPPRAAGALRMLAVSARDLLRLFPETAFRHRLIPMPTLRQRMVVVNTPELVRQVFILDAASHEAKSRHFRAAVRPVLGDSMFGGHGRLWAERRAIVARLIHPSRNAEFHPVFSAEAEALADRWRGRVDVSAELGAATATVVLRLLFPRTADPADAASIASSFGRYEQAVLAVDFGHLLGLPEALSGWQGLTARREAAHIRGVIRAAMARADAAGEGGLYAELRDALNEAGQPALSREALLNELGMLLLAGSETSANALSWALYLIARHPPTRARLDEEHAAVLGGRSPTHAELARLPFTRAVLQEAMRLYPPVAYLSREAARAQTLGAVSVKAGDTVMALPWLLHRHEHLWDAPHAFRPERFMPDAPRKPPRFGYIPFSLGPRVCAGAAFAQAEMTVFLAVLLQRLDVAVAPDTRPMPWARLSVRPKGGMPLVFTPRG